MCDYSLESTARRDAVAGDQLKTARIGMHATVGLIAPDEPNTAVCLVPGTRLILSPIPRELQLRWGVGEVAVGTFAKSSRPSGLLGFFRTHTYRDGIVFDGAPACFLLFQEFPPGVEVSVELVPGDVLSPGAPLPAPRHTALT